MLILAVREYCSKSVIRGHHICETIRTPEIIEILCCEQERSNHEDSYAVIM